MASTRNLNTHCDYKLEKQKDRDILNYMHYEGFKVNNNPCLFKNGPNPNMYGGELSKNTVDVESMLRGIGSTNLEGESFIVVPKIKPLKEISYFDKIPMIIPPSYETMPERPNYLG